MSTFVEALQRAFISFKITDFKLNELLASNKITNEEYNYITS